MSHVIRGNQSSALKPSCVKWWSLVRTSVIHDVAWLSSIRNRQGYNPCRSAVRTGAGQPGMTCETAGELSPAHRSVSCGPTERPPPANLGRAVPNRQEVPSGPRQSRRGALLQLPLGPELPGRGTDPASRAMRPNTGYPRRPASLLFRCAVEIMVEIREIVDGNLRPIPGRYRPANSRKLAFQRAGSELLSSSRFRTFPCSGRSATPSSGRSSRHGVPVAIISWYAVHPAGRQVAVSGVSRKWRFAGAESNPFSEWRVIRPDGRSVNTGRLGRRIPTSLWPVSTMKTIWRGLLPACRLSARRRRDLPALSRLGDGSRLALHAARLSLASAALPRRLLHQPRQVQGYGASSQTSPFPVP
jgi:hypothetical protein